MKLSKGFSVVLSSALLLSSVSFVSAETTKPQVSSKVLQQVKQDLAKKMKKVGPEQKTDTFKANDDVRIVVETDGQTPLEYATQKGVLYKDLPTSTKSTLKTRAIDGQKKVKASLQKQKVSIKLKKDFSTAFTGFSGIVKYKDIAKIKKTNGVKDVYIANEYERPEPNMTTSHSYIQSIQTWADGGYKGEGMVVSVIDTGIDPSHKDFVLSPETKEKLTKGSVNKVIKDSSLKGKFYTEKVPYGYNYFDQNNTILDLGPEASEHGMHVAGTVAANGDKDGVKGVAPEAQVLAMKVFSNDPKFPSTYSDIYLAAIDESIALGADVLNMSLGSAASFYDSKSPEDLAITRAVKNGIVCAVSAGNAGYSSYGYDLPTYENPDIGLVGAPGLNADTIQVAASGNTAYLYEHKLTSPTLNMSGFGIDSWEKLKNPQLIMLSENALGKVGEYQGKDVKGKVVVVKRGDISFNEKTLNALAAGAAGIIVIDHGSGIFYKDQGGWGIPFMHITKADGEKLINALKANEKNFTVSLTNKQESEEMGRMTDFTSWGTTPSLQLKPEITAPGGNIYSTLQDDKYGLMSGTSMAAPHVAGGSALVQQFLQTDKRFKNMNVKKRTELAKTLLMNTAKIIDDLNGQPFSPRRQGAGMMQTYSAVTTPVYLVNETTGKPKFEFGEFKDKKLTFNVKATNTSTKNATYNVNTRVLADSFQLEGDTVYNPMISYDLKDAKISGPKTVTIPAGGTKSFTITVDLKNAKVQGYDANKNLKFKPLEKNAFVEGFVTLSDGKKVNPTLSLPYVGFYGEWDEPEIVDGLSGEKNDYFVGSKFDKDFSDFKTNKDGKTYYVSPVTYNNQKVYPISPNGDGLYDDIMPYLSFLRNAKEVQYNILNSNKELIRKVQVENDVRKSYTNGNPLQYIPFKSKVAATWDGKSNMETVKDGLYYYEVKSIVDYKDSNYQSKKIPILVDTTGPEVKVKYDSKTKTVTWTAKDSGSGIGGYAVLVNGTKVAELDANTTSYTLPSAGEDTVTIIASDKVYNLGSNSITTTEKNTPIIFLDDKAPEALGFYKTTTIPVAGYITEDTKLTSFKVNSKDVAFTYDAATKRYNFKTTIDVAESGKQIISFEASDVYDNKTEFARHIYVDTVAPVINVTVPTEVTSTTKTVDATFTVSDNFGFVDFYVNDNNEYKGILDEATYLKPTNKTVKVKLKVDKTTNTFKAVVRDAAGNESVKEFTITKK
ncbi:MAG: S8 family serine peptidase [Bacillaceae bacterium]